MVIESKSTSNGEPIGYSNREFETKVFNIKQRIRDLEKVEVICDVSKEEQEENDLATNLYGYLKKQQGKLNGEDMHEDTNVSIMCHRSKRDSNRMLLIDNDEDQSD